MGLGFRVLVVTLFNVVWSDALALNRRPCIGPSEDRVAHAIVQVEDMQALKDKYSSELVVMMRVYFEKPHTTVGWRGLINDPDLNGTFNVNTGLRTARKVLLDINELGVPAATEFLDLITSQYISDLTCWGAIGARMTESQEHREMVSGLGVPVGFKNGTSMQPHSYLGISAQGIASVS